MPRLDVSAWLLWVSLAGLQALLVCLMLHRGLVRRWPAVFAFLSIQTIKDAALIAIALQPLSDGSAAAYFYVYWVGSFILCAVRVWIVVELATACCSASSHLGSMTRCSVICVAVATAAVLCLVSIRDPAPYAWWLMRATVSFQRIVGLSWVAAFLAISWTGDYLGLRWADGDRRIALGVGVQATGESVLSWLIASFPLIHVASNLQDLLYLTSLVVWGWAICRKEQTFPLLNGDHLRELVEPFLAAGQAFRGKS